MGKIKIHIEESTARKILALLKKYIVEETDFDTVLGFVDVYKEIAEATGGKIREALTEKRVKKDAVDPVLADRLGLQLDTDKIDDLRNGGQK